MYFSYNKYKKYIYIMKLKFKKINCPKCFTPVEINIANATDEDGEEFLCPNCKFIFRYVDH